MRPRDIVVLDLIPLLPNGKIDRRALPLPGPEEKAEAVDCNRWTIWRPALRKYGGKSSE